MERLMERLNMLWHISVLNNGALEEQITHLEELHRILSQRSREKVVDPEVAFAKVSGGSSSSDVGQASWKHILPSKLTALVKHFTTTIRGGRSNSDAGAAAWKDILPGMIAELARRLIRFSLIIMSNHPHILVDETPTKLSSIISDTLSSLYESVIERIKEENALEDGEMNTIMDMAAVEHLESDKSVRQEFSKWGLARNAVNLHVVMALQAATDENVDGIRQKNGEELPVIQIADVMRIGTKTAYFMQTLNTLRCISEMNDGALDESIAKLEEIHRVVSQRSREKVVDPEVFSAKVHGGSSSSDVSAAGWKYILPGVLIIFAKEITERALLLNAYFPAKLRFIRDHLLVWHHKVMPCIEEEDTLEAGKMNTPSDTYVVELLVEHAAMLEDFENWGLARNAVNLQVVQVLYNSVRVSQSCQGPVTRVQLEDDMENLMRLEYFNMLEAYESVYVEREFLSLNTIITRSEAMKSWKELKQSMEHLFVGTPEKKIEIMSAFYLISTSAVEKATNGIALRCNANDSTLVTPETDVQQDTPDTEVLLPVMDSDVFDLVNMIVSGGEIRNSKMYTTARVTAEGKLTVAGGAEIVDISNFVYPSTNVDVQELQTLQSEALKRLYLWASSRSALEIARIIDGKVARRKPNMFPGTDFSSVRESIKVALPTLEKAVSELEAEPIHSTMAALLQKLGEATKLPAPR